MAQPLLHEYSADYCDLIYGEVMVGGYAPDKFIEAEYAEDDFKKMVGSLGDVARSRLLDRSGKFMIHLLDTSPSNDSLMALAIIDRTRGRGFKPFYFRDRSSNTVIKATQAWVKKIPKVMRGKESGNTEWEFECAFLDIKVGGGVLGAISA